MIYIVVFLNFHPFVRRLTKQMALIIVFTRVGCVRHLFYIYIILFSSLVLRFGFRHPLLISFFILLVFTLRMQAGIAFSTIEEIPKYRDIKPQKYLVYCCRWSVHLIVQKRTRYHPWLHSQALTLISIFLPQAGLRINKVGCVAENTSVWLKSPSLSFFFDSPP